MVCDSIIILQINYNSIDKSNDKKEREKEETKVSLNRLRRMGCAVARMISRVRLEQSEDDHNDQHSRKKEGEEVKAQESKQKDSNQMP